MKKIILLLPLIAISCSIGDFSDIGSMRDPLYVFAGTDSQLIIHDIEPESGALRNRGSIFMPGSVNRILADHENRKLIAASGDTLYAWEIHENGELSMLDGYPFMPYPGTVIQDVFFADNYSYIFVTYGLVSAETFAFRYDSGNSFPDLVTGYPFTLAEYPETAESANSQGFMYYSSTVTSWYNVSLNSDGSVGAQTLLASLPQPLGSLVIADRYLCIFRDAVPPNPPYLETSVHLFGTDSAPTGTARQFVDVAPGGIIVSSYNRENSLVYLAHNNESMIYAIPSDDYGNIGSDITSYYVSGITDFRTLDTDPYGKYLVFSESSYPSFIYTMELGNSGRPENGTGSSLVVPENIISLSCFRYQY